MVFVVSKNATLCVKYLEECWVYRAKKKPLESFYPKVLWPMLIRGGRLSFEEIYNNLSQEIWLYFIGQSNSRCFKKNVKIVDSTTMFV
jgi:hypothetical protein